MKLRTLPQHITRRLLQHESDTLTPAHTARAQQFSRPCPRCNGALHQIPQAQAFTVGSVLPRTSAQCVDCGFEVDTQSGVITKTGNPAKVEEPFPLIQPKDG